MGQSRPLFRLFSTFPHDTIQIQIDKSVDGVLRTQTWGGRMEGTDESTELGIAAPHKCAALNLNLDPLEPMS